MCYPLTGHTNAVWAVAVAALPDGSPVIVSGSRNHRLRVWRLADGSPVGPPLRLPAPVADIAVHDNIVVIAAHTEIAVHKFPAS